MKAKLELVKEQLTLVKTWKFLELNFGKCFFSDLLIVPVDHSLKTKTELKKLKRQGFEDSFKGL